MWCASVSMFPRERQKEFSEPSVLAGLVLSDASGRVGPQRSLLEKQQKPPADHPLLPPI
jgi:hypothetical protein